MSLVAYRCITLAACLSVAGCGSDDAPATNPASAAGISGSNATSAMAGTSVGSDQAGASAGSPGENAQTTTNAPGSGGGAGGSRAQVAGTSAPAAAGGGGDEAGRGAAGTSAAMDPIAEKLDVADVWAGHPVGFDLLTRGDRQFAAFYDRDRALTLAARKLGESNWVLARLPTMLGWDSHNAVVMGIDADGFIHVAGNMHSSPLIYFRSTAPLDVTSMQRVPSMVGTNEDACTYPRFFHASDGSLIFMYRSGSSGNGDHIFNRYDSASRSWRRLLGSALTDGEGQRNAYPVGPIQGPDGDWHLVWVWRDTPDASTNHDVSYARSSDLITWQSGAARPLPLPIRLQGGAIVDPVPIRAGMINNNTQVGFDAERRPIVSYHKYDRAGNTQLYNARFENGAWAVHQTSQWNYRWEFGGGGTLIFEIRVAPVELLADGTLIQRFYHQRFGGDGAFKLDPTTLAAEASIAPPLPYPAELAKPEATTPNLEVQWQADSGKSDEPELRYMLRWETLPENRDMPRNTIPPPSRLRLYAFRR